MGRRLRKATKPLHDREDNRPKEATSNCSDPCDIYITRSNQNGFRDGSWQGVPAIWESGRYSDQEKCGQRGKRSLLSHRTHEVRSW